MAHLVRCFCGRLFRCEIKHAKPTTATEVIDFIMFWNHGHCPDMLFHGEVQMLSFAQRHAEPELHKEE